MGLLASIALGPSLFPTLWHQFDKIIVYFWASLTVISCGWAFSLPLTAATIAHTLFSHYIPFIILIGTLFVISGGIHITVKGKASPSLNTLFLLIGALIANFVGTTGAAILLIRPFIALNKFRKNKTHTIVFFIFTVANVGGCLTPLGDPPLFLGFLEGVPFFWPLLNLWKPALILILPLLLIFWLIDSYYFHHDPKIQDTTHFHSQISVTIKGLHNICLLGLVIASILLCANWADCPHYAIFSVHLSGADLLRDAVLLTLALVSWHFTSGIIHHYNHFDWAPLKEVVHVFLGIFITIVPVMGMLKAGYDGPFSSLLRFIEPPSAPLYFWLTGILSSFLDNAPTYLVFFFMAGGKASVLTTSLSHILQAISLGAVFMGAITYIGNAPNFMVRSIAEKAGIKMPSFIGYMGWSLIILGPLFLMLTFIFF